jgi:hypothetical protein
MLHPSFLISCAPVLVFWKGESEDHFLQRITHLNMQQKDLTTLEGCQFTPNLKVIYAFNNRIDRFPVCFDKLA